MCEYPNGDKHFIIKYYLSGNRKKKKIFAIGKFNPHHDKNGAAFLKPSQTYWLLDSKRTQIHFLLKVEGRDRVKQNWIKYGSDFKEKSIQINRIKIQFLKLLTIHFKKITFRIIIGENRNYLSNILYNSCTGFFRSVII